MRQGTGMFAGTLIAAVLMLGGCAVADRNDQKNQNSQNNNLSDDSVPVWVSSATVKNGMADTQCVATNHTDINTLEAKAVTLARVELARQLDVSVKAMDTTYHQLTESSSGQATSGTSFASVSRQLSNVTLAGSEVSHAEYVQFPDGVKRFCARVALSPERTKVLFKKIVAGSGVQNLTAQNEAVLYEQFLDKKAAE